MGEFSDYMAQHPEQFNSAHKDHFMEYLVEEARNSPIVYAHLSAFRMRRTLFDGSRISLLESLTRSLIEQNKILSHLAHDLAATAIPQIIICNCGRLHKDETDDESPGKL